MSSNYDRRFVRGFSFFFCCCFDLADRFTMCMIPLTTFTNFAASYANHRLVSALEFLFFYWYLFSFLTRFFFFFHHRNFRGSFRLPALRSTECIS